MNAESNAMPAPGEGRQGGGRCRQQHDAPMPRNGVRELCVTCNVPVKSSAPKESASAWITTVCPEAMGVLNRSWSDVLPLTNPVNECFVAPPSIEHRESSASLLKPQSGVRIV